MDERASVALRFYLQSRMERLMKKQYLLMGVALVGVALFFLLASQWNSLGTEVQLFRNRGYNVQHSSWTSYYTFIKNTDYIVKVVDVSRVTLENILSQATLKNVFYDDASIWTPYNDGTTLSIYKYSP